MPVLSTEDLLDAQQVADLLGLSHRNSVTTYANRYPGFPAPVVVRSSGRVRLWARGDVQSWRDRRAPRDDDLPVNQTERGRILDATRRLLLADPFSPLSVRRIADEAGVPHPVLYRHVRTKQELLELVIEDAIARIWSAMDDIDNPSWRKYVPEVARVMLANADSVRLFALWLIEGGGIDRFEQIAIIRRMLAALTRDGAHDGSGDLTAPAAVAGGAALLVGAIVFEPRIDYLLGPDLLTADVLTEMVVKLLEMALPPDPPDPPTAAHSLPE